MKLNHLYFMLSLLSVNCAYSSTNLQNEDDTDKKIYLVTDNVHNFSHNFDTYATLENVRLQNPVCTHIIEGDLNLSAVKSISFEMRNLKEFPSINAENLEKIIINECDISEFNDNHINKLKKVWFVSTDHFFNKINLTLLENNPLRVLQLGCNDIADVNINDVRIPDYYELRLRQNSLHNNLDHALYLQIGNSSLLPTKFNQFNFLDLKIKACHDFDYIMTHAKKIYLPHWTVRLYFEENHPLFKSEPREIMRDNKGIKWMYGGALRFERRFDEEQPAFEVNGNRDHFIAKAVNSSKEMRFMKTKRAR